MLVEVALYEIFIIVPSNCIYLSITDHVTLLFALFMPEVRFLLYQVIYYATNSNLLCY